jgi:DNA segregation ATPase FtsK/SpoIIIE, S-DNA-T family
LVVAGLIRAAFSRYLRKIKKLMTMAKTNKFIAKTEEQEEVKEKKPRKESAPKKQSSGFDTSKLTAKFNSNRWRNIMGALLLLFAFYFLLACISYFFTWKPDQDRVLGKGLFEFLFEDNDEPVENWLGKFGAWISHLFIYRWFGVASLGFSFMALVLGAKMLLRIQLMSLGKMLAVTSFTMVWTSIFLGFFVSRVSNLGGAFGFEVNDWLKLSFGGFGAFLFVILTGFTSFVILFNPDLQALWAKFKRTEDESDDGLRSHIPANEFEAVNTLKEEQIITEKPAETIDLTEEDEEDEPEEEWSQEDEEAFETLEIVSHGESVPEENVEANEEFSVEIAENEEALSEEEINQKVEEFGTYDPTLDLSSYTLPPIDLLKEYGGKQINVDKAELENNKNRIVETLANYNIEIAKIKATVGPTVTLYEIIPAPGVRISKIKNLEDDIALSLAALGIRIIAPIPGKGTIGIEVPNSKPEMVSMRSLIASEKFQNSDMELPIVMGKTITNETLVFDLTKMPHLLVAGATGQGKSVGLNAIMISVLYKKHPSQVKFVLVDPKKVELTLYNKIERHFLAKLPGEAEPIITDTSKVVNTLNSLCIEMDDRYELLKEAHVRNLKEYNEKFINRKLNPENGHRYMPYIVVLIDEFADLIMTAGKEVEHPIARLAQLARAIGIHLIVATQRPSVNVITGMIKANFPARIAFRVLSKIDSRTILDASGADQLIGRGDMLISTGNDLTRLQCGFVDTPEVDEICDFIGDQRGYPDAYLLPEYVGEGAEPTDVDLDDMDSMFVEAARIVVIHQQGSASLLQRKLKLGYNRAGRIVDQLEAHGVIGPFKGSKAREVLIMDEMHLEEFLKSKGLL